jgi:enoyl-CoA hydratase/carnithine racemase
MEIAATIASKNPDAIKADKRLLNSSNDMSLAELLQMESEEQNALIGSPNQIEAVMSEMEKRLANFS